MAVVHDSPGEVALLRWPAQQSLRDRLAAEGLPRLLLISRGRSAPRCDLLEDWVREPLDAWEIEIRTATLRRRARATTVRPHVEQDLVWVGTRWLALAPAQLAVARLLISSFGHVVPLARLQAVARAAGGSGHLPALRTMMVRLKRRLGELDLSVRSVRERGYVLDWPAVPPPT
jgi:DNA-binding response OmpR family regulator